MGQGKWLVLGVLLFCISGCASAPVSSRTTQNLYSRIEEERARKEDELAARKAAEETKRAAIIAERQARLMARETEKGRKQKGTIQIYFSEPPGTTVQVGSKKVTVSLETTAAPVDLPVGTFRMKVAVPGKPPLSGLLHVFSATEASQLAKFDAGIKSTTLRDAYAENLAIWQLKFGEPLEPIIEYCLGNRVRPDWSGTERTVELDFRDMLSQCPDIRIEGRKIKDYFTGNEGRTYNMNMKFSKTDQVTGYVKILVADEFTQFCSLRVDLAKEDLQAARMGNVRVYTISRKDKDVKLVEIVYGGRVK